MDNTSNKQEKNGNSSISTYSSPQQLVYGIRRLATGAQFYWYLTLVSTLWFTFLCLLNSFIRGASSQVTIKYYSLSLSSILVTYLIILRQTYKNKPIAFIIGQLWQLVEHLFNRSGKSTADSSESGSDAGHSESKDGGNGKKKTHDKNNSNQRSTNILRDENVLYLLFALFHWLFASPFFGAINPSILYSFSIYALFHASHYSQQFIIPLLPYVSSQKKEMWCANIRALHRNFNEKSRMLASNTEVLLIMFYLGPLFKIFFRVLLGRFWTASAGGSEQFWYDFKIVILFLVTVAFLRARYLVDDYTRAQINNYDAQINRLVWHPLLPDSVRQVLMGLRTVVGNFAEAMSVV